MLKTKGELKKWIILQKEHLICSTDVSFNVIFNLNSSANTYKKKFRKLHCTYEQNVEFCNVKSRNETSEKK